MLALVLILISPLPPPDTVPLYDNLGTHHVAITTRVPKAQRYFDQGMRLAYGFNHGEAIRAFNEAARLDPDCAMCYWGAAYAYGPHVNAGMDSAAGVAAYAAAQQALSLAPRVKPWEQAYIRAVAQRYAAVPPADRAGLDSAYARAMGQVVRQFPNDLDAAALYAEALMDLRPWNYWDQKTGEPYPGTTEIVAQLERVLKANPSHPGACHYYIHAVEAVQPQKAVGCAERLAALMPGAGHMVHMPAHIYIRVGRYNDAIEQNVHAVHTDEMYIEGQKPQGIYSIGYYPHNYHFLAFAAAMAGRSRQAVEAARKTAATTPAEVARQVPPVEPFITYPFLTLTWFGRWDDVLALPLPPADLRFSVGLASYARGIAFAAKGQWGDASAALDTLRAAAAAITAQAEAGWVTPKTVLDIATQCLLAEIHARRNLLDGAIRYFRKAAEIEDGMQYIEPPDWYYPVRHSLGAVLLKGGRAAEAEQVYREDLKRFPENGWSLFGLAQALHAEGKHAEAAEVEARFRKAWEGADVRLTASRF
jgi:tetratricopeptide (TPR) repeat protein